MKMLRIVMVLMLSASLPASALASDLAASAATAAREAAAQGDQSQPTGSKALKLTGLGLFATGMTIALYGFINNENGTYSEFGEAAATNKKLGAAGMGIAFAGGLMMFLGTHKAKAMPSIAVGRGRIAVGKQVSW
jgi:hypothetical protein